MFDFVEIRDNVAKLVEEELRVVIAIRWGIVVGDKFDGHIASGHR